MKPHGVTFDFYLTLIRPRGRKSRGESYQDFLSRHYLQADTWEHKVLYDIFEYYAASYDPDASEKEKHRFWAEFAKRLFKRTKVVGWDQGLAEEHAEAIRRIFSPVHFELYPEVKETLQALKDKGIKMAVISNWQRGLRHFCRELDIAKYFSAILASAELGWEKPDPRIFQEACKRLKLEPCRMLHVGDSFDDDIRGGRSVGFQVLFLNRTGIEPPADTVVIKDLREVLKAV